MVSIRGYRAHSFPVNWLEEMLRKHSKRCRSLIIAGQAAELSACLSTFRGIDLPSLQVLKLHPDHKDHQDHSSLLSPFSLSNSSLTALSITIEGKSSWCDLHPISLASLRRLHLSSHVLGDLSPLFGTLGACHSLEHLWWDCEGKYRERWVASEPEIVVLPNLLSLRLVKEASLVIQSLEAPRLEQLIIASRDVHANDSHGRAALPPGEFVHTRQTAFPSLRRFACTPLSTIAGKPIISLLQRSPLLEDISVIDYSPLSPANVVETEDFAARAGSLSLWLSNLIDSEGETESGDRRNSNDDHSELTRTPEWLHFLLRSLAGLPSPRSVAGHDSHASADLIMPPLSLSRERASSLRIELDIRRRRDDWILPSRWSRGATFDREAAYGDTLDAIVASLRAQRELRVHMAMFSQAGYEYPAEFLGTAVHDGELRPFMRDGRFTVSQESNWERWPDAWTQWRPMGREDAGPEAMIF